MHNYEKTQEFNFITKYLHSTRYKNLYKLVSKISKPGNILKIVDIGCGPAKTYEVLSELDIDFRYLGIEPRDDFVEIAEKRYGHVDNFQIVCDSIENNYEVLMDVDLIIGLESFEHIHESIVVRLIENIGNSNFKYLYVTVPNEVGPAILVKNVGAYLTGYKRYKEYTWAETFSAATYNLDSVARHGTGHKGFDWRWLAHTLRQNCKIINMTRNPFNFIPRFISPSIGFICRNDQLSD